MISIRVPCTFITKSGWDFNSHVATVQVGPSRIRDGVRLSISLGPEDALLELRTEDADRVADCIKAILQSLQSQKLVGPGQAALSVEKAERGEKE